MFLNRGSTKIHVTKRAHLGELAKRLSKKLQKAAKTLWHRLLKPLHFHLATRPHNHLMQREGSYKAWHEWRFHKHVHLAAISGYGLLVFVLVLSNIPLTSAAGPWTQSDWSGGTGTSSTNQYSDATNIDAETTGQASIAPVSEWSQEYIDWDYRRTINIDNTNATLGATSDTLTDFPVAVRVLSASFDYTKTQDNGQDVRFADSAGNALSYEIEKWNESATSTVWVKVPSITANQNSEYFYMYYGNSVATDAQDSDSVWNSNFTFVHHLEEPTGTTGSNSVDDSTSNNRHGTPASGLLYQQAGKVGDAIQFTGANGISLGTLGAPTLKENTTISYWIRSTNVTLPNRQNPLNQAYGGWGTHTLETNGSISWFMGDNGGNAQNYTGYSSGAGTVVNNTWAHLTFVRNAAGDSYQIYKDGALLASGNYNSAYPTVANQTFSIGFGYLNTTLSGRLDEFRVEDTPRSAGWVAASYNNQNNGAFTSVSAEEIIYENTGTLTSVIFDADYPADWATLSYVESGTGTISVKVRSDSNADMSTASDFASCTAISSGSQLVDNACVDNLDRYIQYEVTFMGGNGGIDTPVFEEIQLEYTASDQIAPITNASNMAMYTSEAGSSIGSNEWTPAEEPYFTWDAGADNIGGTGVKGYCLYIGQDDTADPVLTKGMLGTSPVATEGACQFIVSGEELDLSIADYLGTPLASSSSPYYLNVKVIDIAGNVYDGASEQFQFRFDNTPPSNPAFISAPSQFVADKEVTLTWDAAGGSSASDANSGVAGLQYRIGSSGTWYGDSHSGSQDSADLLANDGSYTTQDPIDFDALVEGNNIVYFRTWDAAGNTSTANVTTVIKLNTTSPSSPQNVDVTPSTNTTNSFAFSWLEPASYTGSASNMTYCYTVNTLPSGLACSFTDAGETSLSADAYATQPGENTFYVVAKDEAGNINYATYSSVTFTANTSAPGMPQNTEVADISVKSTANWKIALSWEEPEDVGAGVSTYRVYRSTDNDTFSLAATTSSNSYVDQDLSQTTYYYYIKACDSANNCGAASTTVDIYPTGRYTEPAELITQPSASGIGTRKATISWITDRDSDSKIALGTSSGNYSSEEVSNSTQTNQHQLKLTNLNPGTTYYYVTRWTDEDGNTGTSAEKSFKTLPAPTVKDVVERRILLSSAVIDFTSTNAVKVKIYFGKTDSFGGVETVNTSSSESSYTVELEGLDDGDTYFYKLNPIDSDGNEYDGTTLSFTTPARPRISNIRIEQDEEAANSTYVVTWTTNVPTSSQVGYQTPGFAPQEVLDSKLVTEHAVTISKLIDKAEYSVVLESRDKDGNLAISDTQIFETPLDTRPPKIDGTTIETSIRGSGASARGQFIVSWKTDEPSTSQVSFGQGTSGDFTNKSAEDAQLVTDHVVVVSDLPTSTVFHVKPVSSDNASNQGEGPQQTAIIGRANESILTIIINTLQKIIGI